MFLIRHVGKQTHYQNTRVHCIIESFSDMMNKYQPFCVFMQNTIRCFWVYKNRLITSLDYLTIKLTNSSLKKDCSTAKEKPSLTDRRGGKEAWLPTHFSWYQTFFCIFQMSLAMATLGLKEMGKFLWEGREKSLPCWLSHLSKIKLRQPTWQNFSLPSQRNFPISFKPKVAKQSSLGKCKKNRVLWKVGWTPCLFSS